MGERIGDYELKKILPDRIVLESEGDSFEVLLYDTAKPKTRTAIRTETRLVTVTRALPGPSPAEPQRPVTPTVPTPGTQRADAPLPTPGSERLVTLPVPTPGVPAAIIPSPLPTPGASPEIRSLADATTASPNSSSPLFTEKKNSSYTRCSYSRIPSVPGEPRGGGRVMRKGELVMVREKFGLGLMIFILMIGLNGCSGILSQTKSRPIKKEMSVKSVPEKTKTPENSALCAPFSDFTPILPLRANSAACKADTTGHNPTVSIAFSDGPLGRRNM